jgi:hypothetical protein
MDGEGNPIFIDSSGKVFICYHDSGEMRLLVDSFELLIEDYFREW